MAALGPALPYMHIQREPTPGLPNTNPVLFRADKARSPQPLPTVSLLCKGLEADFSLPFNTPMTLKL